MADDLREPLSRVIRPLLWCRDDERVREVAARMVEAGQSYALVRAPDGPGIVTDHDFRTFIGTGAVSIDAPISRLATSPAIAINDGATAADALLRMVEDGVHHLVVTDGSATPVGVVRAADLAQCEARQPLQLRSAIDLAPNLAALAGACGSIGAALAELRGSAMPARNVGAVHAALVDAALRRALAIRADPIFTQVRHSWLLLGSLARREPLPSSDLDTALVWSDQPSTDADPGRAVRIAATGVIDDLERCGLTPCSHGARADNPLFSRSQTGWGSAATTWLRDPIAAGALLLSAIVTDSRPVTESTLGHAITGRLMSHTRTSQFLRALLDEAVRWRTSTGRLRAFTVERNGAHRGRLDLKRGGLVPVVALGRWIAIVTADSRGTTVERIDRGADAGLITDNERDILIGGFDNIYTVLYDVEVRAMRSGETPTTYVDPRDLDPLTRRHLRDTLRAIDTVQSRVDQFWIQRLEGPVQRRDLSRLQPR